MALDPITGAEDLTSKLLGIGNTLIDRLIPDKTAAAAAKVQLVQMQVAGELDQIKGQIAVDKVEAGSQSVFVAGWRPYIGWILGSALAYGLVLQPFTVLALVVLHSTFDAAKLPVLDAKTVLELLGAMLGFGVLRTVDKANGTGNGQ